MEPTSGVRISPRIEAISDEIRRSHHGDPWHGPAVSQVLEGVSAAEAATRAVIGAHTIWEIVLHLAAWRGEVARRTETGKHGEPPEGDWPEVPRPTSAEANEAAWSAAKERLAAAEVALQKALVAFPAERLDETFGTGRDAPLGTGVTWGVMLHGVAQHDAYHAGQIMILRKALAAEAPAAGTA